MRAKGVAENLGSYLPILTALGAVGAANNLSILNPLGAEGIASRLGPCLAILRPLRAKGIVPSIFADSILLSHVVYPSGVSPRKCNIPLTPLSPYYIKGLNLIHLPHFVVVSRR